METSQCAYSPSVRDFVVSPARNATVQPDLKPITRTASGFRRVAGKNLVSHLSHHPDSLRPFSKLSPRVVGSPTIGPLSVS